MAKVLSDGSIAKAQLMILLVAIDRCRSIYPTSVEDYCNALVNIARAIGLPGDLPIEDTGIRPA